MNENDDQLSACDEMVLAEIEDTTVRELLRQVYVACKKCDDKNHADGVSLAAFRLATGFPAGYPSWGADTPSGFSNDEIVRELQSLLTSRFPELQK